MSDVGEFFLGNIIAGAGIALSVLTGGVLSSVGLAIASIGVGMMSRGLGITGRPSRVAAQQSTYDPTATLKVVYGRTWVGLTGADIWVDHDDVSDHQSLWTFGVFSVGSENGQGVEDVEQIKIDGIKAVDPVTTGSQTNTTAGTTSFFTKSGDDLLSYNVRLGTFAQAVNTDAQGAANNASDRYPNSFRFRGLCYAAFNMWKHKDVFPNFPRSISALVKGRRVYDPRNPTDGPDNDGWIWDDADTSASLNQPPGQNPALILLDYLTSAMCGGELFYPERDGGDTSLSEIDEQSFIDGANYCDELVQDGDGGTQPRFSFNDWIDTGNDPLQNAMAIMASMRAFHCWQEGKFRLVIPQTQSSVMTLSEDDIIGDWSFRRAGQNEVPNRVVATIPERQGETATEIQFPDEDDTTFLDQDGGVPQVREIPLYGVDDPVRAEQIAMVALREAREDVTIQFRATERAAELEVGDVFTLDHKLPGWQGGSAKDFRAIALTLRPDFTVEVTAQEYAASAYSLDSQTRPTPPPGSDLPDPTSTGAPTSLSLTSDATTQTRTPAGDKVPGIEATWDLPTDDGIDRVVVVERENGTSTWNTADVVDPTDTQRSLFRPQGGSEADTWEVGVYVLVGQRLLKSSVTTATVTLDTDYDPSNDLPSAVNLLGEDAGPEQEGTGGFGHRYMSNLPSEDPGLLIDLAGLKLDVGDVISLRALARSATGTDRAGLRIEFRDSSDSLLSSQDTNFVTTSTAAEIKAEDVTIPANTDWLKILQRNPDGTEEMFTKQAMLNRGPVAAPYTDPPPIDGENLLPFSALVEFEDTTIGGYDKQYLGDASAGNGTSLTDLGLEVGNVISGSIDLKTTGDQRGRLQIRFYDSGDALVSGSTHNTDQNDTGGSYERIALHGIVVPPTATQVEFNADDDNSATSGSIFWRRAMLNRGPRAAPFSPPNFKEFLDDAFSIWRDLGSQSARMGDIVQRIRDDGQAKTDFRKDDGAFPLGYGTGWEPGTARDGAGESFSVSRNDPPEVFFWPGGGLFNVDGSGSVSTSAQYGPDYQATNKDAAGFTPSLKIKETAGTTSAVSIASWTDPGSTQDLEANKSQTAEAWDDEYTLRHHVLIGGNQIGGECFGNSQTCGYYYNKGSGWVKDGQITRQSGCSDFDSDVTYQMTVDGMGSGSDFGVNIDSGAGSISDPDTGDAVSWETATAPAEETATPSGAADVPWTARASG